MFREERSRRNAVESEPDWAEFEPKSVKVAGIWLKLSQRVADPGPTSVESGPELADSVSRSVELAPNFVEPAPSLADAGPHMRCCCSLGDSVSGLAKLGLPSANIAPTVVDSEPCFAKSGPNPELLRPD